MIELGNALIKLGITLTVFLTVPILVIILLIMWTSR